MHYSVKQKKRANEIWKHFKAMTDSTFPLDVIDYVWPRSSPSVQNSDHADFLGAWNV